MHSHYRRRRPACGLRAKRNNRQSTVGEQGNEYDGRESISGYFEQNGVGHDDQHHVFTPRRDQDRVQHDDYYFHASTLNLRTASFVESSPECFRGKTLAVRIRQLLDRQLIC